MKKRHLLCRIGISVASILLVLVGCEIFLRNFYPQATLNHVEAFSFPCFEEGEHRWIKLKSNTSCVLASLSGSFPPVEIKTNSEGLRNPEIPMEKPPDTKRILFIGDSFTMGWGVKEEEAYPRVVESLLNGKGLPHKIETINAGFSAAGPSGYYLSLKYQGMQYEPDMVIIGFYLGNDIAARKYIDWVQTDEDGLPDVVRSKNSYIDFRGSIRFKDAPLKYQIPILRNSHLFMFLLGKIPGKNYFDVSSKMMTQTTEDLACIFNKDCHDLDEVKNDQKKIFLAMKAITKEKGIPLVVVFIPIEFQVNFNAGYKANLNLPLLPSERRYPIDEFSDFFEGNGITYIDLLPPFLTSLDQNLYFRDDDHWNAKGHAFAAEIISKKIIEFLQ